MKFIFLLLCSFCLWADPVSQSLEKIREHIKKFKPIARVHLEVGDANTQVNDLGPIVEYAEKVLESKEVQELVKNSNALQEYLTLMKNHLLHVSLRHKIVDAPSIEYMYPHELPFEHSGEYPAVPTVEALEKVEEFLNVIATGTMIGVDFDVRKEKLLEEGFRSLEERSEFLMEQDRKFVDGIGSDPISYYNKMVERIEKDGLKASFKEFSYTLKLLHQAISISNDTKQAILIEPKLATYRESVLRKLDNLIAKGEYPYRETLSLIMWGTEFLDIIQRTVRPKEANPLHYAKRYEYYMHYMFNLAPKHFSIPTSVALSTYDLISISSVPIGYMGITTENLWVDSYNQTPNEFTIHDGGNHERRRFQFTRNYAQVLGVKEESYYNYLNLLDSYNKNYILPMIKRIDESEAYKAKNIEEFKSIVPGANFYIEEINQAKNFKQAARKINEMKELIDLIIFEVVHEDALPPSPNLIIESLLRPANLPMPRDFIDSNAKTAYHSMESAGTTISYVIHKLNGSFYDTPEKRMDSLVSSEYRSPKKIIQMSARIIENLGGHESLSYEQILKQLVYLTITDEGFLSYLVEEFQRDLHPIQRSLHMALKYAEALEILSLTDSFTITDEFNYYLDSLKKRIQISAPLSLENKSIQEKDVLSAFKEMENNSFDSFEALKNKYFKLSKEINERIFEEVNILEKNNLNLNLSEEDLREKAKRLDEKRERILSDDALRAGDISDIEKMTYESRRLKEAFLNLQKKKLEKFDLRQYAKSWEKINESNLNIKRLAELVSYNIHDFGWRSAYVAQFDVKEHYRKVPDSIKIKNESIEETLKKLEAQGFLGLKIEDGHLYQNINTEAQKIVSELHQEISYKAAMEYIAMILKASKENKELDFDLYLKLDELFHHKWMELNKEKLSSAFKKLGLDIMELQVDEIMEMVANLSLSDWQKMNYIETKNLRQFRPLEELSQVEKKQNRFVLNSFLDGISKEVKINDFLNKNSQHWLEFGELKIKTIVKYLIPKMHDEVWLPNNQYPDRPNYKEVPIKKKNLKKLKLDLEGKGFSGLMIKDGTLYQDINRPSSQILPELLDVLTRETATEYVSVVNTFLAEGKPLSYEEVLNMAEKVHMGFMKKNKWQLKSIFNKLSLGDPIQMNVMDITNTIENLEKKKWLKLNDLEIRKLKQFRHKDKLNPRDFGKDLEMVFKVIESALEAKCNSRFS